MKFYTPQIHLVRRRNLDEPDEFFLHAVTYCHRINYRADGYYPLPEEMAKDGTYTIGLKIKQDKDIPNNESLTPVVHTIKLGPLPLKDEEGIIKVNVFIEKQAQAKSINPPKATSTVSTTDADEDSRPIIEDF